MCHKVRVFPCRTALFRPLSFSFSELKPNLTAVEAFGTEAGIELDSSQLPH